MKNKWHMLETVFVAKSSSRSSILRNKEFLSIYKTTHNKNMGKRNKHFIDEETSIGINI